MNLQCTELGIPNTKKCTSTFSICHFTIKYSTYAISAPQVQAVKGEMLSSGVVLDPYGGGEKNIEVATKPQ